MEIDFESYDQIKKKFEKQFQDKLHLVSLKNFLKILKPTIISSPPKISFAQKLYEGKNIYKYTII